MKIGLEEYEEEGESRMVLDKSPKTYVITSAQACYYENKDGDQMPWGGGQGKAKPHEKLLKGLERYSKEMGAEMLIVPIAGKRTTEDMLHEKLANREDIFRGEVIKFNKNLQLRNLVVPPQNVDPTTGKSSSVAKYDSSIIIPHTKQRTLPVAVAHADLPRFISSTGAVTLPNYSRTNHRGDSAHRNHIFGGIVVEVVDNTHYNVRHLRALQNGKFADLGIQFDGTKKPKKVGVDSIVVGDWHKGDEDEDAIKATYEMIEFFKPKHIVLHDYFNGHSVNHHEADDPLKRAREFNRGRLSLERELEEGFNELVRLSKFAGRNAQIYLDASNHHDFLPRYIRGNAWQNGDIWNAEMASFLYNQSVQLELPEQEIDDASWLIEKGMSRFGKIPSSIHFLRRNDKLKRYGFLLSSHGDKGKSGGRGGTAKARVETGGGKSITGHSHRMEVFGDTYIVGTSSRLDLPYTAGYANASNAANAVLYENGTVQMIPMIEGKWKMKR